MKKVIKATFDNTQEGVINYVEAVWNKANTRDT